MKRFFIAIILVFLVLMSSCGKPNKSDQEIIAEYVQERFFELSQISIDGSDISLDDAEAILYCFVHGDEDISPSEAREAMSVLKARLEDIRDLIADIDDIDIEDPW